LLSQKSIDAEDQKNSCFCVLHNLQRLSKTTLT